MNTSLATFMKLAATALIIAFLILGLMAKTLKGESAKYNTHLHDNMDTVIQDNLPGG